MKFMDWIKGVYRKMFAKEAKEIFGTDVIASAVMDKKIACWKNIAAGRPPWTDAEDGIDSINFGAFLGSDVAKKICLNLGISVGGSAMGAYLQGVVDEMMGIIRDKVEDAVEVGGIIFKPNGNPMADNTVDYIINGDFLITDATSNGNIRGAIFFDYVQKEIGNRKVYYTRLEHHRFQQFSTETGVKELYVIENKAYRSDGENKLGREIPLKEVPEWGALEPVVYIDNVDRPLFAYYKMIYNNPYDRSSPLGISAFHNCEKELRDLDVAWCRKGAEIEDSKHLTIVPESAVKYAANNQIKLPRFLRGLEISGAEETQIHEHVATLLTDQRIMDINSTLSMISTKVGFSQGAFVLDRKTGRITATQVESDDSETIETIKEMRDALQNAIDDLLYALSKYAELYNLAPAGSYKTDYSFGDLLYNYEEDKTRHWQYVQAGKYPLWRYYVKFEGMSEQEAKAVAAEAKTENKIPTLYGEE